MCMNFGIVFIKGCMLFRFSFMYVLKMSVLFGVVFVLVFIDVIVL